MEVKSLKLPSIDDVFSDRGSEGSTGAVVDIRITELHEFFQHAFEIPGEEDEKMMELAESVREHGILMPLIVRPRPGAGPDHGGYEIIAGHCRRKAATLLGIEKVPCLVRNYDDDEATVIMVDSNIQREDISIWEKATAYRLKSDAMRHQGVKGGITTDDIGEKEGESGRQIRRYIRISYLIPAYKDYINSNKISFLAAVALSYLSEEMQDCVFSFIRQGDIPGVDMANYMKEMFQSGKLTEADIQNLFKKQTILPVKRNISIKETTVNKYFPPNMEKDEIAGIIDELLRGWTATHYPELLDENLEGKDE